MVDREIADLTHAEIAETILNLQVNCIQMLCGGIPNAASYFYLSPRNLPDVQSELKSIVEQVPAENIVSHLAAMELRQSRIDKALDLLLDGLTGKGLNDSEASECAEDPTRYSIHNLDKNLDDLFERASSCVQDVMENLGLVITRHFGEGSREALVTEVAAGTPEVKSTRSRLANIMVEYQTLYRVLTRTLDTFEQGNDGS